MLANKAQVYDAHSLISSFLLATLPSEFLFIFVPVLVKVYGLLLNMSTPFSARRPSDMLGGVDETDLCLSHTRSVELARLI